MRRKNTARRGIIIRSITRRTAMPLYLSGPNDSRNNRGSRYQETFFFVSLRFFSPPRRHVNPRRARDRRALRHIFLSGHAQRPLSRVLPTQSRPICIRNFSLSRLDTAGVAGKIQVRGVIGRYALETSARLGYTQRERHLSQRSPRGKFYSARDVARYRGYYFPRIFFVISANCTRRAGGRSQDLRRRSPVSRNARLSTAFPFV